MSKPTDRPEPDARIAEGWRLLDQGRLDDADRVFELASAGSSVAAAANGRGACAARRGDMSRATEHFERAVQAEPTNALYRYQLGVGMIATGRLEPALRAFEETVRLDPEFGEAWFNLGMAQQQSGRPDVAASAFRRSFGAARPVDVGRLALAAALRATGDAPAAIAAAREAIQCQEGWSEAWHELGLCLAAGGDLDGARSAWTRSMEIEPGAAEPRFHLGVLAAMQGRLDDAERLYQEVCERHPQHARARVNLAGLLMHKGRLDAADRELEAAARHAGPHASVVLVAIADLRLRQDRVNESEQAYREAVRLAPRDARGRHGLVGALLAQGRGADAMREIEALEVLAPNRPEVAESKVEALVALARLPEAEELIQRLIAAGGPTTLRHALKGRILESMGRTAEARVAYEHALAMNPNFAPAADGLDRLGRA